MSDTSSQPQFTAAQESEIKAYLQALNWQRDGTDIFALHTGPLPERVTDYLDAKLGNAYLEDCGEAHTLMVRGARNVAKLASEAGITLPRISDKDRGPRML